MYAAYLGRGQVDLVDALGGKKGAHLGLLGQVQLGMGAGDDVVGGHALGQQVAHNGAAHHAAVACYKNTFTSGSRCHGGGFLG